MNKALIPALVVTAIVGGTAYSAGSTYAQDSTSLQPITQMIAERFGLDQTEVETVFDEHHQARHAYREARFNDHLSNIVETGTITVAQMEAIQAKHEEQQAFHESLADLEPEARREAIRAHHQDMETWAEANGIDLNIIRPQSGRGGGQFGSKFGH